MTIAAARQTLAVGIAGAIAVAVPGVLFARLILYHFYVQGSFLLDSGLLASLLWHAPAALPLPPSLGGNSFFAFHVAPLLLAVDAVGSVLPLTMPQLFAGFVGLSHALLALAVFWLLAAGYGMRRGLALLLAALAGIGFACGGLAIAIARYPHFETFGAACLLLAFAALLLERRVIAVLVFAIALATREDLGLHAFGFLALWAASNWHWRVAWRRNRWIVGFAIAGLLYSATALAVQHAVFPGHSSFARVYLGEPAYAHLTRELLTERAGAWLRLHVNILLPAIGTALWAARTRNPAMLLGYVACLPWALLHLFAASELAGLMVAYYAYPFLIAMAWPLLAGLIRPGQGPVAAGPAWTPAAAMLGLAAITWLPIGGDYDPGHIAVPEAFLQAPSLARQALTDRAVATLAAARPTLGRLEVDNSIAALLPFGFSREEVATWATGAPDTLLYFTNGFDAARMTAATNLPNRYAVRGTSVRIATNRPPEILAALGLPLEPAR